MIDFLSLILLTGALAGTTRKWPVVIEGTVAGLPDGEVRLRNQAGTAATARLTDGRFRMETQTAFPNDYVLLFDNGHRVPVVIEKSFIHAEIDFSDGTPHTEIEQFDSGRMLPVPAAAGE